MSLRQLDSERKILSKAFESFSGMLLYANGKKKTLRRERLIESLAQDLIYNCSNETKINKTCSFRTLHQM